MPRIKEEDIDALRERADIVDVVSGYSQLKKSGGHTFKGLCPFHSEKTPSFTVDSARGLFYCFGCQAGGNVYQFVENIESLTFAEAVEWLARKTGFDLSYEQRSPGEQRVAGLKLRLYEANAAAMRFWHETLLHAPEAEPARRYLGSRGFKQETADRWKLGFAPGRDATSRHLLERGFTAEEILKADLARRSERDGSLYDSFRRRIVFPTWNLQGDVAGFGARAVGDEQPKYLNTSDTPVFQKSRIMYGLDRAKSDIARSFAVVVEGYTDVIALHEAGIRQAVATNGVALGESHFELLKKFSGRAVLMFDADAAGVGATERGFGLHHRIGLEVMVAPLPLGRDPADVASQEGSDGVHKLIDTARPLLEFKLEQTVAKLPLDTPEARARAARAAAEVLRWHPDPIARHQYAFIAARRIGVDPEGIQRALGEGPDPVPSEPSGDRGDRRLPGHVKVEREALRLLLNGSPAAFRRLAEIDESHLTSAARRDLYRKASQGIAAGKPLDAAEIAGQVSPDALSLLAELTVGATEPGAGDEAVAEEVFTRLKVFKLEREIKARRDTLQDVNPLADAERHDLLFTEFVTLEAERRDLLKHLQESL